MDTPRDLRFAELVREHQAGLRAFIRMLGAESWAVDDLAQEAFLVALRRLDDLDPALPAGPWLRGIARNLVRNHNRSEGRHRKVLHVDLIDALAASTGEDQVEHMHLEELVRHLRICVSSLPEHARTLIEGRYGEGSVEDGRSDNAMRQALFRIRETLRRCLIGRVGGEAWL